MRYKILLEYDGTDFCGWQKQKNPYSVQEVLEKAIFDFTGEKTTIFGAGRTDSGVHALGQIAHFDLTERRIYGEMLRSINHFVKPRKVSAIDCVEADRDFHARFSAKARHYTYRIINRRAYSIFEEKRAWAVKETLDLENMCLASRDLLGTHDFTSFRANVCQAKSPVKTMSAIEILREGDIIKIELSARSFLHRMVRNIVGSLVEVGKGEKPISFIKEALEAKSREAAGPTAPPYGLYLTKIDY